MNRSYKMVSPEHHIKLYLLLQLIERYQNTFDLLKRCGSPSAREIATAALVAEQRRGKRENLE